MHTIYSTYSHIVLSMPCLPHCVLYVYHTCSVQPYHSSWISSSYMPHLILSVSLGNKCFMSYWIAGGWQDQFLGSKWVSWPRRTKSKLSMPAKKNLTLFLTQQLLLDPLGHWAVSAREKSYVITCLSDFVFFLVWYLFCKLLNTKTKDTAGKRANGTIMLC